MPQVLGNDDLDAAVAELDGWRVDGDALVKELEFAGFSQAFAFLTRVAMLAEKRGHHPDFECSYRRVRLSLTSHDAGGVTRRDVELATALSELLSAPPTPKPT